MRNSHPVPVVGKDGLTGSLLDPLPEGGRTDTAVRIRLSDGRTVEVPASLLVVGSDGTVLMPLGPSDLADPEPTPRQSAAGDEQVLPVLAEELVIDKRPVQTGGVRVNRRLIEHDELVEMPLMKEHVDVRRVLIDREVDGPLPIREEGDVLIIPIVQEVLVVAKRYRLKEEVQVRRTATEELHRERVTVRRQEPIIERIAEDGSAVPIADREPVREAPPAPAPDPPRIRRKSLLD